MITDSVFINSDNIDLYEEGRLTLSNGVKKAESCDASSKQLSYLKDRFIPTGEWRNLDRIEIKPYVQDLLLDTGVSLTEIISLQRLPDYLIRQLLAVDFNNVNSHLDLVSLIKQKPNDFKKLNQMLLDYISSLTMMDGASNFKGIRVSPGNLVTTAHTPDMKLVGLHIDNSSGQNPMDSQTSQRRLCINIGRKERYFIFVNKSIRQLLEMVRRYKAIDTETYFSDNSLTNDFFNFYPDYPIIRIKQCPYDFYIAPTDNIIHDGSTENSHAADIDVAFVGDYSLKTSVIANS